MRYTFEELMGAAHEFKTFDCECVKSKSLAIVREQLRNKLLIPKPSKNDTMLSRKEIEEKTKELLLIFFNEIDFKAKYLDQETLDKSLPNDFRLHSPLHRNLVILEIVSTLVKSIDLFEIPVTYSNNDYIRTVDYLENNIHILKKLPVCFDRIFFSSNLDVAQICTQIHEYLHVLTLRHKGSINNYYHSEILSVFMELVSAEKLGDEVLTHVESKKFSELLNSCQILNEGVFIDKSGLENRNLNRERNLHIIGILLAEALFDLYLSGNRKGVLKDVQTILNGKGVLEDLLDDYQINFENSSVPEAIEKRIKRF